MSMINYNREEGKGMLKLRFLPVLLALFLFSCASGDAQAENVWRTLGASFDPFSGTITYYTRPAGGGDLYPEMDIFFSLSFSDDGARDYRIYFDYPSEPLALYSDGNPVVSFSSAIEDTYARSYIPLSEDETERAARIFAGVRHFLSRSSLLTAAAPPALRELALAREIV